ncbi:MAG TPA: helix-turn-helix transcriptional regulator [Fastidiosipila sp.]|nr:helix-turn-helix transcriptional regulator [Fastidiosipila sp.]
MSAHGVKKILGMRLAGLRAARGLRQVDVARALNCDRKSISHYERGEREPDLDRLVALADFYKCTIDFLLGRSEIREDWHELRAKYSKGYLKVADLPHDVFDEEDVADPEN